jgi:phosphoribosylformylglycinamidine synthase
MSIGEMVTNLMGVLVSTEADGIRQLACICNWMWPANLDPHDGEMVRMIRAAEAIDETLRRLGIAIVGGKDSSSMAAKLRQAIQKLVKSLNTIVFGSLVSVPDVARYVNPQIKYPGDSVLIHLDIANGQRRLGGSSAAQCLDGQLGDVCADLDDVELLGRTYCAVQRLIHRQLICAGHDLGHGGLLTAVTEMAFANDCGLWLDFSGQETDARKACLADELGYVVECRAGNEKEVRGVLDNLEVPHVVIGKTADHHVISVKYNHESVLVDTVPDLRRCWERTSHEFHKLFVDPAWAKRERRNTASRRRPQYKLTFAPQATPPDIMVSKTKHKLAVVRDKASNGYEEMAAAWLDAGFDVCDIHMSDLITGRIKNLDAFRGQIYPGGFTHGDVFGSAIGWSLKTLLHPNVRQIQRGFYARGDTFSFGTCNGAQYGVRCGYAPLPELPDREQPRFTTNKQGAFNHQWVLMRINQSPAIMLKGMAGSILGAYVAHGEGYFDCDHDPDLLKRLVKMGLIPIVYVDPLGRQSTAPPYSPNGSFVAGVCDRTGRHLFVMPHLLDRTFQSRLAEYTPPEWDNIPVGPWSQMAQNAREWCDQN